MTIAALYHYLENNRTKHPNRSRSNYYRQDHCMRLNAGDEADIYGPGVCHADKICVLENECHHYYRVIDKAKFSRTADDAQTVIDRSTLCDEDKERLTEALARGVRFADGQHWSWYFGMALDN